MCLKFKLFRIYYKIIDMSYFEYAIFNIEKWYKKAKKIQIKKSAKEYSFVKNETQ